MKVQPPSYESSRLRRALAFEIAHAVALVLAGATVLWFAILLPSRLKTDSIRERKRDLLSEQARLDAEVKSLRTETKALDEDPWAIEKALRKRLGFLRPGERVLKLER